MMELQADSGVQEAGEPALELKVLVININEEL